jgi:DNA replication protein DnaC
MLISNYRRRDFAKTLSPAVLDRIYENGVGIEFTWDSYRRKID